MDAKRFDNLLRSLARASSRRAIARAVAGLTLAGPLSTPFGRENAAAKNKRKRKKKCAKAGQAPKKKKRCCRGLAKDAAGRCNPPCDVCQPAGACAFDTVQAAIDATSQQTNIRICPGYYVGDLTINRSLTLIGAGDGISEGADTILVGSGNDSVVVVAAEIEVNLQRLRIEGGKPEGNSGGGIRNFGDLTLTDCTITGNSAIRGGGIFSNSSLTLTKSTVTGNTGNEAGGGIYNAGTVRLDVTSRVSLNEADLNIRGSGGGIFNNAGTVILSSPDNVSDNTPDQCGGTAVPLCSG